MPEPYIAHFPVLGITSIVMDEADYNSFIDELRDIIHIEQSNPNHLTRTSDHQINALKAAKHLPLMGRGTRTEKFFTRYGVKGDKLSVIVRGHGKNLLDQLLQPSDKDEM